MAVSVTHTTVSGGVNDPAYDVSKNAWNEAHTVTGLGTMAEQAANSVAITGGSITGITDLAVADGGTGASTAAAARTNLSAGYAVNGVTSVLATPADATTYVFGQVATTVYNLARMYVPRDGTLKAVYINIYVAGTLASNETSTVSFRLNDTTDTTITTGAKADATAQNYSITGMSVSVAAGDTFVIKWVTPTWGTNPTNLFLTFTAYFE